MRTRPAPAACVLSAVDNGIAITVSLPKDSRVTRCDLYRKDERNETKLVGIIYQTGVLRYTVTGTDVVSGQTCQYYYVLTCKDGTAYPDSEAATLRWVTPTRKPTPKPTPTPNLTTRSETSP